MDADEAENRVGSVVDSWTIEHLIGIGGMAAVYAARKGGVRRAIKVLHPNLARSQRALDRFRREEGVLRMSLHPAVPRVYESGTAEDGAPYLAMDLLLGETVETRRRRFGGRLPWAEVVEIAQVVLHVLEVAHARAVLHRDVKPSNVLWLDDGSIRLIDFGIARAQQDDDVQTRTGELPGSLPFMSPEHVLGVPDEIDERSDLWALGATMFLLLSGRPVHESSTDFGALALSASKPARSLRTVASGLPPTLVATVDRALEFDRDKRFASAAEMRAALAGVATGRSLVQRPWRWSAAVAFTLGLLGAWRLHVSAATRPPPPASVESPSVEPVPSLAPAMTSAEPTSAPLVESPEPVRPGRSVSRPSAVAPPAPSVRCDPPFVIDPMTGTRRVKPGC